MELGSPGSELRAGIEPRTLPQSVTAGLKVCKEDILNSVQAILTSPIFEETGAVILATSTGRQPAEMISKCLGASNRNEIQKELYNGFLT